MTSLLKGVVERGTAARARSLERPIAGKTGTTNDYTDGWFVGFEPSLACAVWVGFDEKKDTLGRGADGAHTALPIWIEFRGQAMKGKPVEDYPVPANIVFVPVDAGGLAGPAPNAQVSAWRRSWPERSRAPRPGPRRAASSTGRPPSPPRRSEHLLARLLRAGGADRGLDVLLFLGRRQDGLHPERLRSTARGPSPACGRGARPLPPRPLRARP